MHFAKVTAQVITCCLLIYLLGRPAIAYANGTITVTTTQDEFGGNTTATCSLREAIEAVNLHSNFGGCTLNGTAPFTIQLGAGVYTLSQSGTGEDANQSGDLDIHAAVSIQGAGAEQTRIQAGATVGSAVDRVFQVMQTAEVLFADLTIEHGSPEPDGNGGGILNMGQITINDSVLSNNHAYGDEPGQGGGALYNGPNSVATLNNSHVRQNQATTGLGNGGGIFNGPHAILVINGGSINQNSTARAGGGIENDAGIVTLNNLSLTNNLAGINGGGLHTSGNGHVHMNGGEARANVANAEGGGLWNSAIGTMVIEAATIVSNTASGAAADQGGGGLFSDGGALTVLSSTIISNTANGAAGSGGGILATVGSVLHVTGGMISHNHANRAGGGIELNASAEKPAYATLTSIELSGNSTGAAPGNGGALHITGPGHVKVTAALVTNNSAAAEGGGLWNSATGTLLVVESTLRNNLATGNDPDQGGGALFTDGGDLTVIQTTLSGNRATGTAGSGGGILANVGSTLYVANSTLTENHANRAGGGIEITATAANTSTAQLEQVDFTDNTTGSAPGNGGALHITGPATVMVLGGTATGNQAAAEGGGFWNSATGTLTVQNVTLENNQASGAALDQGGGALFTDGGLLRVMHSTLTGNVADGAAGSGGGILAVPGSTLEITGGSIISNTARRAGGGIEVNGNMTATVTAMINGVQMRGNETGPVPGNGGALHITGLATVTINGGIVTGNLATAEGGGLWNSATGTLIVIGTKIQGNIASGNDADQGGGGLFNDGGTLRVHDALIHGNSATGTAGSGGGVLNNRGTVIIATSTISANSAKRAGGGVEDNVGILLRLQQVRLLQNLTGAAPGNGGGLHLTGAGRAEVLNSIVAANHAAAEGGGLWNSAAGTLLVSGSTVHSNSTTNSSAATGVDAQGGGGLFNDGGALTMSNSTITENQASNHNGDGLLNVAGTSTLVNVTLYANADNGIVNTTGTVALANSIVAHHDDDDCLGTVTTNGAPNLDSDDSCNVTVTADPLVGALAQHGGQTPTLALLEGSPAINGGDNGICAAAPVNGLDQRGVFRPQGASCDLGAYEAISADPDGEEMSTPLFLPLVQR
ncbi:MAG: CSLREA domain-containing protein [Caldilineaceae bacterium]|nr:CSLREA domain-containing protein [Caldilineaceae bacterium]